MLMAVAREISISQEQYVYHFKVLNSFLPYDIKCVIFRLVLHVIYHRCKGPLPRDDENT